MTKCPRSFCGPALMEHRYRRSGYRLATACFILRPKNLLEFDSYATGVWNSLGEYSHFPNRVALAGADVISPEQELPEMVHAFDAQRNTPFTFDFRPALRFRTHGGQANGSSGDRWRIESGIPGRVQHPHRTEAMDARGRAAFDHIGESWRRWRGCWARRQTKRSAGKRAAGRHGSPSSSIRRTTSPREPWSTRYMRTRSQHYESSKDAASGLVEDGLDAMSAKIDTRNDDADAVPLWSSIRWAGHARMWPRPKLDFRQEG